MTKPTARPLTAFAFLAENMQRGGDIVSGLIPLFRPVIKQLHDRKFEPAELSDKIGEYYGLDIHPYAMEDIAPRLEQAGLLVQRPLSSAAYEYEYAPIEDDFDAVEDSILETVTTRFLGFCRDALEPLNVHVDEDVLKEAFIDRLTKADFFGILVKPNRTFSHKGTDNTLRLKKTEDQLEWESVNSLDARIDVLVASFFLDAKENNKELFDLVVKITTGALVAEVILDFRSPDSLDGLAGVRIFLDTPFLMSLLDLGSKIGKKYADKIFDQLKSKGALLSVLPHALEEFKDNLNAVLKAKEQGRAYGETAIRLTDPQFKLYAKTLLPVIEERVRDKGIEIAKYPPDPSYKYFTVEEQDELMSRILFHQSPTARERDAKSLATIMRMRAGKRTTYRDFRDCGAVLLTRNSALASVSERHLRDTGKLHGREVPPCITDRYFAGLLWVMFGGERDGIPEHRLLANCARAVQAREDVIEKMHSILTRANPEQAQHFTALMTTDRGAQYFMQLSLGDAALVTEENYQRIYEDLELVAGEKVARIKDEEIAKLRSDHQLELQGMVSSLEETVRRVGQEASERLGLLEKESLARAEAANAELLDARAETLAVQREVTSTAIALNRVIEEKRRHERAAVEMALRDGVKVRRIRRGCLVVAMAALWALQIYADKALLPSADAGTMAGLAITGSYWVLVALIFLLGLWFIPEMLMESYVVRKQKEATHRALDALGLGGALERYQIDWKKGEILGEDAEERTP